MHEEKGEKWKRMADKAGFFLVNRKFESITSDKKIDKMWISLERAGRVIDKGGEMYEQIRKFSTIQKSTFYFTDSDHRVGKKETIFATPAL